MIKPNLGEGVESASLSLVQERLLFSSSSLIKAMSISTTCVNVNGVGNQQFLSWNKFLELLVATIISGAPNIKLIRIHFCLPPHLLPLLQILNIESLSASLLTQSACKFDLCLRHLWKKVLHLFACVEERRNRQQEFKLKKNETQVSYRIKKWWAAHGCDGWLSSQKVSHLENQI